MTTAPNAGGAPATGDTQHGTPGPAQTGGQPASNGGESSTPAAGGQTSGQYTKQQVDDSFKAGQARVEAEYKAKLDAATKELEALRAKDFSAKSAEEQAKLLKAERDALDAEAKALREWRESTEKAMAGELEERASKLPAHLKSAFDVVKDAALDKRKGVLAELEKAAGVTTGLNQPPGGNVGNKAAGIDVAAIVAGMDNGDSRLYQEALKSVNQAELTKLVVEYRGRKR